MSSRDSYSARLHFALIKNKWALVSWLFLIALGLFVGVGPFFLPDPELQALDQQLLPPSFQHWFGTDILGRDLLSRIALGGQLSLMVGLFGTLVSVVIGTIYGVCTGYFGGKIDQVGMRIVDLLYSLPYMFLVILLVSIFGKNMIVLFAALGAVQWLTTARIVRGQVMSLKHQEFILAAQALGVSHFKILLRHILPNILGLIAIYATLTVPAVILQEAFLSFLGLNVKECTWGVLASEGAEAMEIAWWMVCFPGLAITFTLLAFNTLGDSIRDALDPKR
jgi:oligopeptide transport system permease protein